MDTSVIRLVNDTKVYLHAVIDNFSRRILGWCVVDKFEITSMVSSLRDAASWGGQDFVNLAQLRRIQSPDELIPRFHWTQVTSCHAAKARPRRSR